MNQDKLLEKTNQLIRNQNEVNNTLQELRHEIVNVRKMNQNLAKENMELRKKITNLKDVYSQKEKVKVETPKVVIEKVVPSSSPETKIVAEEVPIPKAPKGHYEEYEEAKVVYKDQSINKSAIYEFFLGKNIIAKLAALMISLGIFTFARMAYINWMSDTARFFFILMVGLGFFVVGYLFDKNKSKMFSSTFYSIGVVTIAISLFLGGMALEIFGKEVFAILNLMMIGAVFIYFHKKHELFMDTVLIIVYTVLMIFTNITLLESPSVFLWIIDIITIALLLGIMFMYITQYYKEKNRQLLFLYLLFSGISLFYLLISLLFENTSYSLIVVLITITYLGNYTLFNKTKGLNALLGLQTIGTIVLGTVIFTVALEGFNEPPAYTFILAFIILLPIYIYSYKDEVDNNIHTIDVYAFTLTSLIVVFLATFKLGSTIVLSKDYFVVLNLFSLMSVFIGYFATKWSKRSTHYIMLLMLLVTFAYITAFTILDYGAISIYSGGVLITNAVAMMLLLGIDKYITDNYNNVKLKLSYTVQTMLALVLPLALLIISRELKEVVAPRYQYIYWSSLVYYIVIYKHAFTNKFFIKDDKRIYRNIINIFIILIVTLVNFIYFDHDFSKGIDVLTFIVVLLPNIYILYSIRELYIYAVRETSYNTEYLFIGMYKLGVFVQSMFIHRYINFTYDKILLSSYFMIVAAIGVLYGFKARWKTARYIGLAAIYFSFIKFFVYDFFRQDLTDTVKTVTYITLGVVLMGISFLYSHLEKKYGGNEVL
jgi:hypothetical protein